jgi:hypothetical protein
MEKKEQTMRAGWVSDPVHPNGHIYAKMALNLIEKVAVAASPKTLSAAGGQKRSWSASNREESGQDCSSRSWESDRRYSGNYNSGGQSQSRPRMFDGGNTSRGGDRGPSSSRRSTGRSMEWKARGGRGGYEHHNCGSNSRGGLHQYSGDGGGRKYAGRGSGAGRGGHRY